MGAQVELAEKTKQTRYASSYDVKTRERHFSQSYVAELRGSVLFPEFCAAECPQELNRNLCAGFTATHHSAGKPAFESKLHISSLLKVGLTTTHECIAGKTFLWG